MNLPAQQRSALKAGEPIVCLLEQTECVVLRKDAFERMQRMAYDVSELTQEEVLATAAATFEDVDQAGPIE